MVAVVAEVTASQLGRDDGQARLGTTDAATEVILTAPTRESVKSAGVIKSKEKYDSNTTKLPYIAL